MNHRSRTEQDRDAELLFFTCATGFYQNFVMPYVYFAALHNPSSRFEFIVGDADDFNEKHKGSLTWLERELAVVPKIRGLDSSAPQPKRPNSIRFVNEPEQEARFVYIGDVDIMIVEDILAWHRPIFEAGLPYSNIIRPNAKRLSGLHLASYEHHYPLPSIDDLIKEVANDEALLYRIVERKGNLYAQEKYDALVKGRPAHGIHMSLNRLPFSSATERVSWGISYARAEKFEQLLSRDSFKDFFSTLYTGSKHVLLNLIFLSRGVCSHGKEFFARTVSH